MEEVTNEELIFGHDPTEGIVCAEVKGDEVYLYKELDGKIELETYPMEYWILSANNHSNMDKLEGDLFYEYIWRSDDYEEYADKKQECYAKRDQYNMIYNLREMAQISDGFTYFKGLNPKDVSILGFDIESSGLRFDTSSEVFCISNTLRKNGKVTKRLFSLDEYDNSCDMIQDWCDWVRDVDPTIVCGHNIYNYDLPYLEHVIKMKGPRGLQLGRDDSYMDRPKRQSNFRVDGDRGVAYTKYRIFGRELVDTRFLAMRYDHITKKYDNYQLKHIIEVEGLVKKGRVFYDASTIKDNWDKPEERKKIKEYCIDDGDDAVALYDLMIPAYFYLSQSIPKPFEEMLVSASGSQLNNLMLRSYMVKGHSIPNASDVPKYQGAYSFGNPGIYKNVFKVDVASLYPSIMRQYEIYDKDKDPLKHLLLFVENFTIERLKNKKLSKETGDPYYEAMQQAQKIVINSFYGFLGASGLHFNSPFNAAEVTRHGREILNHATGYLCNGEFYLNKDNDVDYRMIDEDVEPEFKLVNADTDSLSFCKANKMGKFEEYEIQELVDELNEVTHEDIGELIDWEDDGLFESFVVLKTKNYAMKLPKKGLKKGTSPYKFKGSSIKDPKAEPALQVYKKDLLKLMLDGRSDHFYYLYHNYIKRIMNIGHEDEPIDLWCNKTNITENVLKTKRDARAQKVWEACQNIDIALEDRVLLYKTNESKLKLIQDYEHDHDSWHYIKRLYAVTKIFQKVLDMNIIPDYTLKSNVEILEEII